MFLKPFKNGIQRSRFLVLTKRSAASGDENAYNVMCKPNKNKMAGVKSRFGINFQWFPSENVIEITECVYTKKIILLNLGE